MRTLYGGLISALLLVCAASGAPAPAAAPSSLSIFPGDVELRGPHASQKLVVEAAYPGAYQKDVTAEAKLASADPRIVKLDGDTLRPLTDGATTVTATLGSRTATIHVQVRDAKTTWVPGFRNDVLPVMSKIGCNAGACHGALAGKNGFKLTLRGYDPDTDYLVLTRESIGRRVSLADPAHSLMLLKPTLTIPHGGGRRFAVGSEEYNIIVNWIAAGAPAPNDNDPRIQGLEIYPTSVFLEPGAQQQILVRARYSNGQRKDVTRWVKFSSTDTGVAAVDDFGKVKMIGSGEAAITVWYQSLVGFARVGVPYPATISAEVFKNSPRHNYIDDLVLDKLEKLHIEPSGQADDNTFIRRAFLDAMGILPAPDDVERFVQDKDPNKRSKLIEEILGRDEFVDYWAYKWSDLLLVSSKRLRANAMWSFYNWIRASVETNKPWDQFAREIVTSSGDTLQNGALNYYVLHKNPIDLTENITKAFLGFAITCAHCHNHPLEKWTQKDYYQMVNLVARIGEKNGAEPGDVVVYTSPSGDVNYPKLGRPLDPRPLDGQALPLNSPQDRRQVLARWLTSPENPYFARALVNRVWKNFMGRGLVEPVDDLRSTNPTSNEELFAAVTKDFVAHGFDVKHVIRTVMNSAAYQRASMVNKTNAQDEKYYSHYIIKRLPAEVILDAISGVTRVPTQFQGYPVGTRALQLPDSQVNSYFLTVFGRPPRVNTDASERMHEPTITQALHAINGETLNRMLEAKDGAIDMFLKLGLSDSKALDYLYMSAFSRPPTTQERSEILTALAKAEKVTAANPLEKEPRRKPMEDLMWAMLTGKEFLFNH